MTISLLPVLAVVLLECLTDDNVNYVGLRGVPGSRREERVCRRTFRKGCVIFLEPYRAFGKADYKFVVDAKVNKGGKLELKVLDCDENGDVKSTGECEIVYASDMLVRGWKVLKKR